MSLVLLKRFPCHHCTKDFSRKYHLQAHLDSLVGIKRYACDVCTQRFIRQSDLRTHNGEQHSGRPRLQCDKCSRSFDRKSTLQRHQRRSCKADATIDCYNPGIMTLPFRPSPKPAVATSLNFPSAYPNDPMEVDEDVVCEGASLLLNGTNQTMSFRSSRQFAWSHESRPRYEAGIHVLDACRPTHQSTLNIDLITLNACIYADNSITEAIQHPEPLRTEILGCRYSEIMEIAQLGFVRQRMWSQHCCLYALWWIDSIVAGENASHAALDSLQKQWNLDIATAADSPEVDPLDLVAMLVTNEDVKSNAQSGEPWIPVLRSAIKELVADLEEPIDDPDELSALPDDLSQLSPVALIFAGLEIVSALGLWLLIRKRDSMYIANHDIMKLPSPKKDSASLHRH